MGLRGDGALITRRFGKCSGHVGQSSGRLPIQASALASTQAGARGRVKGRERSDGVIFIIPPIACVSRVSLGRITRSKAYSGISIPSPHREPEPILARDQLQWPHVPS